MPSPYVETISSETSSPFTFQRHSGSHRGRCGCRTEIVVERSGVPIVAILREDDSLCAVQEGIPQRRNTDPVQRERMLHKPMSGWDRLKGCPSLCHLLLQRSAVLRVADA